jgi:hypothetical protein
MEGFETKETKYPQTKVTIIKFLKITLFPNSAN